MFYLRSGIIIALFYLHGFESLAVNDVGGTLITLTNSSTATNGAWSWFEDERAIIDDNDPHNTLLLVSSVSSATKGHEESGDIDLLWLNIDTGQQGEFELHNRLEQDDHNSSAICRRPSDGRYVAVYGKHHSDDFMRWRVSTNPGDPTDWGEEQVLDVSPSSEDNMTYSNLHYLATDKSGAGHLYNFTRSDGFDPNVVTSSNYGDTWNYRGKLLAQGDSQDRPYLRYFSDGKKIHFIATEGHPRDFNNSIYHGFIQGGALHNSIGLVVDANIFDSSAVSPTALTRVIAANTLINGIEIQHTWAIDIAINVKGEPVAVFSGRANGDSEDHRFYYAAIKNGVWQINELAKAGGFLYETECDYTGLVAIDPNDTSTLFMSSKIDPRTNASLNHYEIFRGQTADGGAAWEWSPITYNSNVDNLRPLVPKWNAKETALIWMRGTYHSYTDWDTEVVVVTNFGPCVEQPRADGD